MTQCSCTNASCPLCQGRVWNVNGGVIMRTPQEEIGSLRRRVEELKEQLRLANIDAANTMASLSDAKEALRRVSEWWFDGTKEESACSTCDMGDSGRKKRDDGHDFDCPISIAREALERMGEK